VELTEAGHTVSVEFDINDAVTREAVAWFQPEVIIAPFLKRAIPEDVWQKFRCLVVHPGIIGDRGPSALDWAVLDNARRWGVTCLQANAEMDAGDLWAWQEFDMRDVAKSSLYRHEVTEAAVVTVKQALERITSGSFRPRPLDYSDPDVRGRWRPRMKPDDRRIDWMMDTTEIALRKIRAADGQPGVLDELFGETAYLYDAWPEDRLCGAPGAVIARRHGALCRATVDGAVWIGHVKKKDLADGRSLKLPATLAFEDRITELPEFPEEFADDDHRDTFREIVYRERNQVGYLEFRFYNGAMSVDQCERLLQALEYARTRPVRVLVLMGGPDFWSNGMHLNVIEAARSPADESWRNINAIDNIAHAIINTGDRITVAALRGNAGAGGVFLALAADQVVAREGVILNPHYKNMGNLYGSEYWTYLLPRRVGVAHAAVLTENRLPVSARRAAEIGLIDRVIDIDAASFVPAVEALAEGIANSPTYNEMIREKCEQRAKDELEKPLAHYRAAELEQMKFNFYGFDPSYHVARYNFVFRVPHSRTPLHLAVHRRNQTES
jgi:putative two-component system hydrogenase maturation factor HypX/HoxX